MRCWREKGFPILAGILWVLFMILDLTRWGDSTWVKFTAICLCCVTALLGARTVDAQWVAAAQCFTVAADVFLLVLNRNMADQAAGVGLFIAVQLLYAYRLYRLRGKRYSPWGLPLRGLSLLLAAALLVLAAMGPVTEARDGEALGLNGLLPVLPTVLAVVYFPNLCVNAGEAFVFGYGKDREALGDKGFLVRRFVWGLLLFIGCDLCVGGWNLGVFKGFARVGMWMFYLPSQVLIVLSQAQETGDFYAKKF